MNRKGFTLVEMLAVVVILSVVMGIASYGVLHVIDSSKKKTEEVFIDRFSGLIEDYILLNKSKISKSLNSDCSTISDFDMVGDFKLIDGIEFKQLINPKNKKQCFDNEKNPTVCVYRNNEYVYYYYVNLKDNNICDIFEDNLIVSDSDDIKNQLKS